MQVSLGLRVELRLSNFASNQGCIDEAFEDLLLLNVFQSFSSRHPGRSGEIYTVATVVSFM